MCVASYFAVHVHVQCRRSCRYCVCMFEVQVFVQVFFMRLLQHLRRCLYATIFVYIVSPLYHWFFESCELRFFPSLRFWFRFQFISQLYRVSPLLSDFPL